MRTFAIVRYKNEEYKLVEDTTLGDKFYTWQNTKTNYNVEIGMYSTLYNELSEYQQSLLKRNLKQGGKFSKLELAFV